jgi:hypothetical protein
MKWLRELLSDSIQVFLRLSVCNTTFSDQSTVIEESSYHHSCDHLPYQRSLASDDETLTATIMSPPVPPRSIISPRSYLQSSFDLTLNEYSKQTGINLIAHPFVASIDDIDSFHTSMAVLPQRIRMENDSQTGDAIARLMNHLKSIIYIVSLLSPPEALSENVDLVCHRELGSDESFSRFLTLIP